MNKNLVVYEQALQDTFFGGSQPAMIDYMLWPWFERLPLLVETGFQFNADGQFPKLAAWVQAMQANENVKRVEIPTEVLKKFLETYKTGQPVYDFD